jgi:hypothetical protein
VITKNAEYRWKFIFHSKVLKPDPLPEKNITSSAVINKRKRD